MYSVVSSPLKVRDTLFHRNKAGKMHAMHVSCIFTLKNVIRISCVVTYLYRQIFHEYITHVMNRVKYEGVFN